MRFSITKHFLPFALLFLSTKAARVSPRDVGKLGPEGTLNPVQRWRDTIGTALQIQGPTEPHRLVYALRSGPLSSVFRSTLLSNSSEPCVPEARQKCEVAIDGFGSVGEVHYNFRNFERKLVGRSTQIMVACRCVNTECGDAILVRPVNVIPRDGAKEKRMTCVYEAIDGKFSDCHAELLRVSYRDKEKGPEFSHREDYFEYHSPTNFTDWRAEGQRGWTQECSEDDLASLPKIDLGSIKSKDIEFNNHKTMANNSCSPPQGVKYFVAEDDADGQECADLYKFAVSAAANQGSQQDDIAVGSSARTYFQQKPQLVSNTELALISSAGGLGLTFVWTMYWKRMKRLGGTWKKLGVVVMMQLLSYTLEALPLHIALGSEISAGKWSSLFAFVDATLAVKDESTEMQGSAEGSVLVLTALVGEVRYKHTREGVVWGLVVLFDSIAAVIVVTTLTRKGAQLVEKAREQMYVERSRVSKYSKTRKKRTRRLGLQKKGNDLRKSEPCAQVTSDEVCSETQRTALSISTISSLDDGFAPSR